MTNSNKLLEDKKGFTFYASACSPGHGNFLKPIGFTEVDEVEKADLIIFGGGADVDPETYDEKKNRRTWSDAEREAVEKEDFKKGRKLDKKFFGICRGHQLLVALAGGKLIQDVTNHHSSHSVTTYDGLDLAVNSIHHQMVNPYGMKPEDYTALAWAPRRLSNRYLGPGERGVMVPWGFKEIEAIYLPKIKAVGVQWHPEMMYNSTKKESGGATLWVQNLVIKLMNDKM